MNGLNVRYQPPVSSLYETCERLTDVVGQTFALPMIDSCHAKNVLLMAGNNFRPLTPDGFLNRSFRQYCGGESVAESCRYSNRDGSSE